jgi:ribonuclease R
VSTRRTLVAELVGRGRGLAARPAFEQGRPIALSRQARARARIGDLVTLSLKGRGATVVQIHGRADDPRAVLEVLLLDAGRRRRFSRTALEEAEAPAGAEVADDPGRRDLREQPVVTIDPEGAKDHDDAVAIERRNGGYRLYVHIADVARFVAPGGALDREAALRCFSAYVPGTVDPMLPADLSADACSLRAGVDRGVVTAEMDISAEGVVIGARFYRALIHSDRDLTYPEVDAYFDGRPLGDPRLERVIDTARAAAALLREVRMARGALEIDSGESRFVFDEHGVADVHVETQTESHRLIEEFMIAANEAVARHLERRGQPAIFRVHDDPDQSDLERLYSQLEALGVATPPLAEGPLTGEQRRAAAVRAARAVAKGGHGGAGERSLGVMVLRSLKQARYSTECLGHSGLASAAYLHFTSPIRRYPDLLVHRALLATLEGSEPVPGPRELSEAAFACSEVEREIAGLERTADRICTGLLLARRMEAGELPARFEGEVVGMVGGGVFVAFGPAYEGFLPARAIGDEYFSMDPLEVALIGERTGRRLMLGDTIDVAIASVDPLRGRVDLEPCDGEPRRRRR